MSYTKDVTDHRRTTDLCVEFCIRDTIFVLELKSSFSTVQSTITDLEVFEHWSVIGGQYNKSLPVTLIHFVMALLCKQYSEHFIYNLFLG